MNQQPDKFFRERLEHYQKPAPASAWEKIAAAQAKKNYKGLWLKIAASLLLLAAAAYLLWPNTGSVELHQPALSSVPHHSPGDSTMKQPVQVVPTPGPALRAEAADPGTKSEIKTGKPLPNRKRDSKEVIKDQQPNTVAVIDGGEEIAVPDETHNALAPDSTKGMIAEIRTTQETDSKSITLIYSANEVDEYLDKNALAEATSKDKKPSTLKKLLLKANDLKNNQDPFGELRQKKNEILALNFKNEKRGQNK